MLSNTKLNEVVDAKFFMEELGEKSLIWCIGLFTFVSGIMQATSSF